jgi:anti-anti-sigma regulatory factor
VISATQKVTAQEANMALQRVREMLHDVASRFHVLADFRGLESMDPAAARHIAKIMDTLAEKNVALVTRVMPDPRTLGSISCLNSIMARTSRSRPSKPWPMRYKMLQRKWIFRRLNSWQLCFLP